MNSKGIKETDNKQGTTTVLEMSNQIVSFLQNIDDVHDANEFFRIMMDALENSAEHVGETFPRDTITKIVTLTDERIKEAK